MDSKNNGDSDYRGDTGVDLYKTTDGGIALGYTQEGEWLEYTVDVKTAGDYKITASVAAGNATSAFKLYVDGKAISDEVSVPQTADNSWDTYETITVSDKVALTAGSHVLKLEITANYANIDWIQFADANESPSGFADVRLNMPTEAENYDIFDMNGTYLGMVCASGMSELRSNAANLVKRGGAYLARSQAGKTLRFQLAK
jgi:hypothetical protein